MAEILPGTKNDPWSAAYEPPGPSGYNIEPHYVYTCDAGNCEEVTLAIVATQDMGWLSLCWKHARRELDAIKLATLPPC